MSLSRSSGQGRLSTQRPHGTPELRILAFVALSQIFYKVGLDEAGLLTHWTPNNRPTLFLLQDLHPTLSTDTVCLVMDLSHYLIMAIHAKRMWHVYLQDFYQSKTSITCMVNVFVLFLRQMVRSKQSEQSHGYGVTKDKNDIKVIGEI